MHLEPEDIEALECVERMEEEFNAGLTVPDETLAARCKKLASQGLLLDLGNVQVVDEDGAHYDEMAPVFRLTAEGHDRLESNYLGE